MAAGLQQFAGKWEVHKTSKEFEAYLDKKDVGMMKKAILLKATPSMELTVADNTISVKIKVGLKTIEESFKIGEAYEIKEPSKATGLTTFADGKLHTTVTPIDTSRKKEEIIREVVDGEIVQTMTCDGVTAKRYLKRK